MTATLHFRCMNPSCPDVFHAYVTPRVSAKQESSSIDLPTTDLSSMSCSMCADELVQVEDPREVEGDLDSLILDVEAGIVSIRWRHRPGDPEARKVMDFYALASGKFSADAPGESLHGIPFGVALQATSLASRISALARGRGLRHLRFSKSARR